MARVVCGGGGGGGVGPDMAKITSTSTTKECVSVGC